MTSGIRKITKEIYERSQKCGGYIAAEDQNKVFSFSELCGYGVYGALTFEKDGEYFVKYQMGDSCD